MKTFNNVNEITEQDYKEYKQLVAINAYCADKKFIASGYTLSFLVGAGSIVGSVMLGGFWLILFLPLLLCSLSALGFAIAVNVGFSAKTGENNDIRKVYDIPANLTHKQIRKAKKEIKRLKKANQLEKLDELIYQFEKQQLNELYNKTSEQSTPKKLILTTRQRNTYQNNPINQIEIDLAEANLTEPNANTTTTEEEEQQISLN